MMAASSLSQLRATVRRFRGRRIAVVGDFMLDRFLRGRVSRVSPEAPVPVVQIDRPETSHLGGAGNVGANLAALGSRPLAFGVVGRDAEGEAVRRLLQQHGVAAAGLLTDPGRPTTVKTRIIADHQHVVRVDREAAYAIPAPLEKRLLAALRRALPQLAGVVLSDYDKGVLTETLLEELLSLCAAKKIPVFIDLKDERRRFDTPLRLVLINERRAAGISGRSLDDDASLRVVGAHLMARFPCETLVITRGARGMVVFERDHDQSFDAVRTRPWEVFDVTGAGDTVLSTLTLALVAGATPHQAAVLANAAAGVVVGKLGTAVCTPKELLAALETRRG